MTAEPETWSRELAAAVRCPRELLRRLELPESMGSDAAAAGFRTLVPESFLRRMRPGNADDPLLRQVLPAVAETLAVEGFRPDAVNDLPSRTAPGVIHKYPGRVLLIAAGSCAVHCRYCFRRDYPYSEEPKSLADWDEALGTVRRDESIEEVILSGGDPLMLPDGRLLQLLAMIDAIPHVDRVRVHTRLPIVLPSRVTDALLTTLRGLRSQPWIVVHANHANEIASDCSDALRRLVDSGVPVLNQAVLLCGINDNLNTQADLCKSLINVGIRPYYLNLLDRVAGVAHFAVPDEVARKIAAGLRERLPGYAVPVVVRDSGEGPSKSALPP